uniref:Golgi SNAP receptor complex member 1-2-like n=1 Tax=Rhizophora mucronata TaxID=61149 RepID=A0A2P2P0S7_RHIMU
MRNNVQAAMTADRIRVSRDPRLLMEPSMPRIIGNLSLRSFTFP